jgi:hypothetical protein
MLLLLAYCDLDYDSVCLQNVANDMFSNRTCPNNYQGVVWFRLYSTECAGVIV